MSEKNPQTLLNQFQIILASDPLIDEVGFVHPSQFVTLNEEVSTPKSISSETNFWCSDHKLGISTEILFPLYNGARDAFIATLKIFKQQKCSTSSIHVLETEIMKHSKALLLLSCDFGTAWDSRKLVLSNNDNCEFLIDELFFSALVLSYAPKSERSWSHRRWVIKKIAEKYSDLQEIIEKESELVEKIAEKSKMNYRTWNYRCWLVSYMSREQVLHELNRSKDWTRLHVADNSGFHYRTRLMLRMLEISSYSPGLNAAADNLEFRQLWKEELDWNKLLINRYIGREALWLHRRFLSLSWIKHFAAEGCFTSCKSGTKSTINHETDTFLHNELEYSRTCSTIPDNSFEDFRAQAMLSATYILWLTMRISEVMELELEERLGEVKTVIESVCPEKTFLWYTCRVHMKEDPVNPEWESKFKATFLPLGVSDHSPIIVKVAEMHRA